MEKLQLLIHCVTFIGLCIAFAGNNNSAIGQKVRAYGLGLFGCSIAMLPYVLNPAKTNLELIFYGAALLLIAISFQLARAINSLVKNNRANGKSSQ